jgi:hypothetical protein
MTMYCGLRTLSGKELSPHRLLWGNSDLMPAHFFHEESPFRRVFLFVFLLQIPDLGRRFLVSLFKLCLVLRPKGDQLTLFLNVFTFREPF